MDEFSEEDIYRWLEEVKDPEIPVLSIVDLGVINGISVAGDQVKVELTPTFVGCPALDMMQNEIRDLLSKKGLRRVDIEVSFKRPWTSDRISEKGRQALKQFGLSPPPPRTLFTDLDILVNAACPRCGNSRTELRSTFGATLCRAIYYCPDCRESFEQFKPL